MAFIKTIDSENLMDHGVDPVYGNWALTFYGSYEVLHDAEYFGDCVHFLDSTSGAYFYCMRLPKGKRIFITAESWARAQSATASVGAGKLSPAAGLKVPFPARSDRLGWITATRIMGLTVQVSPGGFMVGNKLTVEIK